jgi:hypothetical protein
LKRRFGTSQLAAEKLCVEAITNAAPFGEVPKDVVGERQGPFEVTMRFHY